MPTQRGYLSPEKFTELTNLSITDIVEWDRQASLAERYIDLACGASPLFHTPFTVDGVTSSTATTFIATDFDEDKDNYYNNLRVETKQGTGVGYDGYITSYDSSTQTVTVTGSFTSNPDSTSTMIVSQRAFFPRNIDRDSDARPMIPEAVTEATAYAIEFAFANGGDEAFNAAVFNPVGGKSEEEIGQYRVKYELSIVDAQAQIGSKSRDILGNAGLINNTAIITA